MSIFTPSHLRLPFVARNRFTSDNRQVPVTRSLSCPHCGAGCAPVRAINTRCIACLKHLLLEDVVIRGDCVRNHIITGGTILVEPSARFAGTLQGSEVVIAGRVMGTVIGTDRVEITATGKVAGTIATRHAAIPRRRPGRRPDQHPQPGQYGLDHALPCLMLSPPSRSCNLTHSNAIFVRSKSALLHSRSA